MSRMLSWRQGKGGSGRQDHSTTGGFTMVELLVTMLLLTVVILGLAALQVAAIRNVAGSRRSAEATRLAQAEIERLKADRTSSPLLTSTGGAWNTMLDKNNVAMTNVGVNGTDQGPFTVQVLIEDLAGPPTGVKAVTVKVSWMDIVAKTDTSGVLKYEELNVMLSTVIFP